MRELVGIPLGHFSEKSVSRGIYWALTRVIYWAIYWPIKLATKSVIILGKRPLDIANKQYYRNILVSITLLSPEGRDGFSAGFHRVDEDFQKTGDEAATPAPCQVRRRQSH